MRIGNGLAWRLSVYRHGLGWHEGCLFIAMAHTLAFTHWHGGCLFIAMAHTLALGWHGGCLFIAMAHTLALSWHGGCLFIAMAWAGMEAVCLSP